MTLAFYLDEDAMRNSVRRALRTRGIDVISTFEAGMVRRPDKEQLEVAMQQGRVLYSFNVAHFCRIHAEWLSRNKSHAGIVLAHQQRFPVGTQVRALQRLAAKFDPPDMRDRLEFLSEWV